MSVRFIAVPRLQSSIIFRSASRWDAEGEGLLLPKMSALVEQTPGFSLLSKVTKYKQEVVMNQTQRDATCKCSFLQRKINKCSRGSFVMYMVGYRVKFAACFQAE